LPCDSEINPARITLAHILSSAAWNVAEPVAYSKTHLEEDGSLDMYTLMKSEQTMLESRAAGSRAYEQKKVGQYARFLDAVVACDQANREQTDRHYVMNDSGQEFYGDTWID
jgi:hypothetical protein